MSALVAGARSIVGLINVAVAVLIGWRVVNKPGLGESLLSGAEIKQLIDHDFASYYSENPATFSTACYSGMVFSN